MNVLLIGGLGYIGSAINCELYASKIKTDIIDLNLFGNTETTDQYAKENIFETYQKHDFKQYSHVIWTIDNDCQRWYDADKKTVDAYISKNLNAFFHICEHANEVIVLLEDPDTITGHQPYKKFMELRIEQIRQFSNVTGYFANEVYGTSERMRYDTIVNGMFMNGYHFGTIPVGNAVRLLPVLCLGDLAKHVTGTIKGKHDKPAGQIHKIASYIVNDGSLAVMVRASISRHGGFQAGSLQVGFSDEQPVFGEKDKEIQSYNVIENGIGSIDDFVRDIMRYAKTGELVMKDNCNNDKIYNNMSVYNPVCEFFRSLNKE